MMDIFFNRFRLNRFRRIGKKVSSIRGRLPLSASVLSSDAARSASALSHLDRTVFFLPGIAPRRAGMILERRLLRDDFFVCKLGTCGMSDFVCRRGMEEMAEHLERAIYRQKIRYGFRKFAIVAVDTAGLVADYYVKRLGGEADCTALITIGTPHRGIPHGMANISARLLSHLNRQLRPESPFIRRLLVGAFPPGVRVASIFDRRSRRYPFPYCALPDDFGDQFVNLEVPTEFGVSSITLEGLLAGSGVYGMVRREIIEGFEVCNSVVADGD